MQNKLLVTLILPHYFWRNMLSPCFLAGDTEWIFTPHILLRLQNSCTSLVQKCNVNAPSALSYFLRLLFFIFTAKKHTILWKYIILKHNSLLHEKDKISLCFFLFIRQCWFIHFYNPAFIHVIKKIISRCTDIWSSMNSWKDSWGFTVFEKK